MVRNMSLKKNRRKYGRLRLPTVSREGEESLMTDILKSMENVQLPPGQLRKLGLDSDWVKKISPEFKERAVRTAIKYSDVLKELSKK